MIALRHQMIYAADGIGVGTAAHLQHLIVVDAVSQHLHWRARNVGRVLEGQSGVE